MPQYLLGFQQPVGDPPPPGVLEPMMADLDRVNTDMRTAGVWVFGGGLHGPEASTVVGRPGDDVLVTDGPYAEGKEFLGGITIVDVDDLDAALHWAERIHRATTLPIEVRPFQG